MSTYMFVAGKRSGGHNLASSPREHAEELLNASQWGVNSDRTPNGMLPKPGDKVVIYAAGAGCIASATVDRTPRRNRSKRFIERDLTHGIRLRSIRRFRQSVKVGPNLQDRIMEAGEPSIRSLAAFVRQGVRPITFKAGQVIRQASRGR